MCRRSDVWLKTGKTTTTHGIGVSNRGNADHDEALRDAAEESYIYGHYQGKEGACDLRNKESPCLCGKECDGYKGKYIIEGKDGRVEIPAEN